MTNAELIDSLRNVYGEKADCYHCHSTVGCYGTACMEYLCHAAADALEADKKRIAELEKSYAWKAYAALEESIEGYKVRIAELEAQLTKEGEWIEDYSTYCGADRANYKCSLCGKIGGTWRRGLKQDELPPFCGSCGARMKTVTDCHTLVEGEHDGET